MSLTCNGVPQNDGLHNVINSYRQADKKDGKTKPPDPNGEGPLSLSKAIKDYSKEYLTGVKELTDEQKAEIKERVDDYLAENRIHTREEKAAFTDFVKSLFKSYGYNGYIEDYEGEDDAEAASGYVEKILTTDNALPENEIACHLQRMSKFNNRIKNVDGQQEAGQ